MREIDTLDPCLVVEMDIPVKKRFRQTCYTCHPLQDVNQTLARRPTAEIGEEEHATTTPHKKLRDAFQTHDLKPLSTVPKGTRG